MSKRGLLCAATTIAVLLTIPSARAAIEVPGVDLHWDPPLAETEGTFFSGAGPVETALALRVDPSAFDSRTDRVYLAEGMRLHAFTSWGPGPAWLTQGGLSYIDLTRWSSGEVSANPVVVNFGDFVGSLNPGNERYPEFILYVGMSDGTVLALRDSFNRAVMVNPDGPGARLRGPQAAPAWNATVDGAVTGIAAYSRDTGHGRGGGDRVAVATATGSLYVYGVAAGGWDLITDPLDAPLAHALLGRWQAGSAVRVSVADGPMSGTGVAPQWSPAFSADGDSVAIGTADGVVHVLRLDPGGVSERWNLTVATDSTDWASPPIVALLPASPPARPLGEEVVWAGSTNGWLFPRYLESGGTIAGWEGYLGEGSYPPGGIRLAASGHVETGTVRQPRALGSSVLAATSEARLYSVRALGGDGGLPPGSVAWAFWDPGLECLDPGFIDSPVTNEAAAIVAVVGQVRSPRESVDGTLYNLRLDTGLPLYRVLFLDERPYARPISWQDPDHISPSIWAIGSGPRTTVYSFSTQGLQDPPRSLCVLADTLPLFLVIALAVAGVAVVMFFLVAGWKRRKPKEQEAPAPTTPPSPPAG